MSVGTPENRTPSPAYPGGTAPRRSPHARWSLVALLAVAAAAIVAGLTWGRGSDPAALGQVGAGITPGPTPTPTSTAVDGVVFLTLDATESDRAAIGARLRGADAVERVAFVDRATAYRRFKKIFADRPDLIGAVRPEDLPESFEFRVRDPAAFAAVQHLLAGLPGVSQVQRRSDPRPVPTPSPT